LLGVLLVSLGVAPIPANAGESRGLTPTEEANLRLYEEYIAAENSGDFSRLASLFDGSFQGELNGSPSPGQGPEGEVDAVRFARTALPDYAAEVEQAVADGDFVIARWRVGGTHRGKLSGIPPTNRRISFSGCSALQFRDGKIIRGFSYIDSGGLLRQLGVIRLLSILLITIGGILGAGSGVLAVSLRRRWVTTDGSLATRVGATALVSLGAVGVFSTLASLLLMILGRSLPA
jgi:steroid delta-isomerase-like uncharacterized protein